MTGIDKQRVAVVGASRGLGRGVAEALAEAGASVLAIARSQGSLGELRERGIDTRVGDATDPVFVKHLFADEPLDAFVLVAGVRPTLEPLATYDWSSFMRPFEVEVKATFHFLQEALRRAPNPSRAVVFSSGAALHGSPLSGGYAPAKQTQRFLCQYARGEGKERGLQVQCVLPQLNPNTTLGAAAIKAYAAKAGETPEGFVAKRFGDAPLSPARAGKAIVELLASGDHIETPELLLTGAGLRSLP